MGSGFLGTRASWAADLNLIAQLAILVMVAMSAIHAKRRDVDAHEDWAVVAVVANAVLIVAIMNPAFFRLAPGVIRDPSYRGQFLMLPHMLVGGLAELLGIYIILALKTELPEGLRFRNTTALMRVDLVLWLVALVGGCILYMLWYT